MLSLGENPHAARVCVILSGTVGREAARCPALHGVLPYVLTLLGANSSPINSSSSSALSSSHICFSPLLSLTCQFSVWLDYPPLSYSFSPKVGPVLPNSYLRHLFLPFWVRFTYCSSSRYLFLPTTSSYSHAVLKLDPPLSPLWFLLYEDVVSLWH